LVTSKNKQMNVHPADARELETFPRLYRFFEADKGLAERERKWEAQIRILENKVSHTMIAARQIFAVAVDCVNVMSTLLKGKLKPEADGKEFNEKMENYKIQLGKYHGMLLADLKNGAGRDKTTTYLDALVAEHKNKLIKLKDEKGGFAMHVDKVIDVCLSLRVNALQSPPEMRPAFVQALVRGNALMLN
jgi:hypothetical protein